MLLSQSNCWAAGSSSLNLPRTFCAAFRRAWSGCCRQQWRRAPAHHRAASTDCSYYFWVSLIISDDQHFFHVPIVHSLVFLRKVPVHFLCQVSDGVSALFCADLCEYFLYPGHQLRIGHADCRYFLPCSYLSLSCSLCFFLRAKSLHLMQLHWFVSNPAGFFIGNASLTTLLRSRT